MYKNPIIVCFIIATLLFLQIYILPSNVEENVKRVGGYYNAIKEDFYVFYFLYIPVIVFIFIEIISKVSSNEKYLKNINLMKNVLYVCSIVFYVLYDILVHMVLSAFRNW